MVGLIGLLDGRENLIDSPTGLRGDEDDGSVVQELKAVRDILLEFFL